MSGPVLERGDAGFEAACTIFNEAVTRRPSAVVPCADPDDVVGALAYARANDLPVAVRGGGHNFAGHALVQDGLVLDLRGLRTCLVDPEQRTLTVGAGLLWRDVDAATAPYGLAVPGGSISGVGVVGFTLGTGLGWLSRQHGLAADNLLGAELVTVDGERLQVDAERHPELFWALRGGCGNFGVVTSLRFRLHPVSTVLAGTMLVALDDAPGALRELLDATPAAPDTVMWTAVLAALPPLEDLPKAVSGRPALLVNLCVTPDEGALAWVAGLRTTLGEKVVLDGVTTTAYRDFQGSADASAPPGHCWDVRSEWLGPLDDQAVADLCEATRSAQSPLFELVLRPLGGAIAEPADDATAFGFRSADLLIEVIAGWEPGDDREPAHRAWMRGTWAQLERLSAGGPDVNHLGRDEHPDRVRACYTEAGYARLQAVKERYDPGNLLRSTQNVPPRLAAVRL